MMYITSNLMEMWRFAFILEKELASHKFLENTLLSSKNFSLAELRLQPQNVS